MNLYFVLIQLPVLLFSVIVHEVSHGWMALRCGDDTALRMGRITLNPLPHLDMVGSVLLPVFAFLARADFIIGWAKPVPVNPMLLKNPRKDMLLVSIAGPASNLLLAFAAGVLFKIYGAVSGAGLAGLAVVPAVLRFMVLINVVLAVFNLLPVPPLDGSKILAYFLPRKWAYHYERIGVFGIFIIIGLLFLVFRFF